MGASFSDRRTATDRRSAERRSDVAPSALASPAVPTHGERRGRDASSTAEPIRRLTAAVEALAARLFDEGRNTGKPTCTVKEAATLLGTTAKGIYALHERGKLPPTVGPGRRLLWRRS